ncbi:MAG: hypothetical protein EBT20_22095 [Alphaproteobacteria bacterium]|nr:hypothetical protein [Alphaproteobacteria bacterium]
MICFASRNVVCNQSKASLKHPFSDLQKQIYSFIILKPKIDIGYPLQKSCQIPGNAFAPQNGKCEMRDIKREGM